MVVFFVVFFCHPRLRCSSPSLFNLIVGKKKPLLKKKNTAYQDLCLQPPLLRLWTFRTEWNEPLFVTRTETHAKIVQSQSRHMQHGYNRTCLEGGKSKLNPGWESRSLGLLVMPQGAKYSELHGFSCSLSCGTTRSKRWRLLMSRKFSDRLK